MDIILITYIYKEMKMDSPVDTDAIPVQHISFKACTDCSAKTKEECDAMTCEECEAVNF